MWHNDGVNGEGQRRKDRSRERAPPRPLNAARLDEMAIRYVSRFATTQAKLRDYLRRKLRERGWEPGSDADAEPPIEALIERVARLGYVDDAAFARAKGEALTARGLGRGRVTQALRAAGVSDDDGAEAKATADESAAEAALHFARRKRIGPFAAVKPDRPGREKWIGAMLRAGHPMPLARALANAGPGEETTAEYLAELGS